MTGMEQIQSTNLRETQKKSEFGGNQSKAGHPSYRLPLLATVGALMLLFTSSQSFAQQQTVPRYQPGRSTVSPYLNLLRGESGVIPNYYAFVRPIENQTRVNQQQAARNSFQRQQLEKVQKDFSQFEPSPTGKAGWHGAQGRTGFQQTSHYYSRWRRPGSR